MFDLPNRSQILNSEFLKAFKNFTGDELLIGLIRKSEYDPEIMAVLANMKSVLKRSPQFKDECSGDKSILDYRTVYKLLKPKAGDKPFSAKSYRKINEYIKLANQQETESSIKSILTIKGAYVIDDAFKAAKKRSNKQEDYIEFYTCKGNSDIQWSGVINGFDVPRPILFELKKEALLAFSHKNSKICAVVVGESGSGKSTVLRRLALELNELKKFIILWVFDISDFLDVLKTNENYKDKYIVIIEDWNTIEMDTRGKSDFLIYLSKINNMRVIVGDYPIERSYAEHIYGENIFYLKADENKEIIERIVDNVDDLKAIREKIFTLNNSFFSAPLFLILFVLFRTQVIEHQNKDLDTNDFLSQFKKIVKNDLGLIHDDYKGIAQVIYYWACINKTYNSSITWEAMLKLADHFQGDSKATNELIQFREKHPIIRVLGHYIFLKPFVDPLMDHQLLVLFQHDLLIDALSKPANRNWYFDDEILLEIIRILIEIKELSVASDLYGSFIHKQTTLEGVDFWQDEAKEHSRQKLAAFEKDYRHNFIKAHCNVKEDSLFNRIFRNGFVEFIYENIAFKNDIYWLETIHEISLVFHGDEWVATRKITQKLIEMGCKSNFIKYTNEMCANDMLFEILRGEVMYAHFASDYEIISTIDKLY